MAAVPTNRRLHFVQRSGPASSHWNGVRRGPSEFKLGGTVRYRPNSVTPLAVLVVASDPDRTVLSRTAGAHLPRPVSDVRVDGAEALERVVVSITVARPVHQRPARPVVGSA